MIWLKRKRKKTLYASYKEKKNQAMSVEVKEESDSQIKREKRVKIEKNKKMDKEQKSFNKELVSNRTIIISVTSLKDGIGCSHICNLLKSYIESKKRTAIILNEQNNVFDYFDRYNYVILDYGNVSIDTINDYKLSDIKILMCILDDMYLRVLNDKYLTVDKWYFFNHVPEKMKGEVAAYMEDYNYYCVPTCVPNALNKEIKREFAKIIKI